MVKAFKSSSVSSVEELGMEFVDTNQNMNFVVSQIDSIQRLAKSTKQIQKNKTAYKKVILENVNGEIRERQSPSTEAKSFITPNAFDCFMQVCEDTPKVTQFNYNSSEGFSPETFLTEHAEKFQSCGENLDKVQQNLDKSQKYYKKFDFFYRRTAFRSMNEFYKSQFKQSHEQWKEGEKTLIRSQISDNEENNTDVRNLIKSSLQSTFGPDLKHNHRKVDLFERAYKFCDDLFLISTEDKMSEKDLFAYTSTLLSIVLSHHYQKDEILSMVKDTSVDFQKVRDTMYKYSKKVEEKFFQEPCYAYFFIQFSSSHFGKQYISNKLSKGEINQEKYKNSREMNERLISEIELMTHEAKQFLVKHFIENTEDTLTYVLLKNIGIETERLMALRAYKLKNNKSTNSIIQSILSEVKYDHIDLTTSAEDDSKMEICSEHQDIQISRFSLSEASQSCVIPSPNKSVTIQAAATKSCIFGKDQIQNDKDTDSSASTDMTSTKYNSFVSLARDVTIIKPKQFKPVIIQQTSDVAKKQKIRLLQKLLTEIKMRKSGETNI